MQADVVVLGAGMVGVSVAVHLQKRGKQVVLVDRRRPGEETSYGNGGLVQGEAVFPHPFPRAFSELRRIARNRSVDVHYHLSSLPGLARPLAAYWRNSEPRRYAETTVQWSSLIATCLSEHKALAEEAGSTELLRPVGFLRAFNDTATMDSDLAKAERAREFGVNSVALTPAKLAEMEPHLSNGFVGALDWTDPYSVSDPHALTMSYFGLFGLLGGYFALGDATSLQRHGSGWRVTATDGSIVEAGEAVIALGIWSDSVTRRFGYKPPLFGKRGYHLHFTPKGNAGLTRPVASNGFLLAPMRRGIRLTTGAEFARRSADAGAAGPRRTHRPDRVPAWRSGRADALDGHKTLYLRHDADHRPGARAGPFMVRFRPCPSGLYAGSHNRTDAGGSDDRRRAVRGPDAVPGRAVLRPAEHDSPSSRHVAGRRPSAAR